jgi:type IV fimbrial biogenesis protein FimT
MKYERGFTLIELMYTVAVGALVLGIGIPAFNETIRSGRMTSTVNKAITAMHVARSEAVKRRARVTLCRSTVSTDPAVAPVCNATATGYAVFVNVGDDQAYNVGTDTLINTGPWLGNGITVQYTGLPTYVSFSPSGFTRAIGGGTLSGNIVVCDDRGDRAARVITVAATGRPQARAHADVAGAPSCE